MNKIESLIESLYETSEVEEGQEKTAEFQFAQHLTSEHNPYAEMSDEDLIALFNQQPEAEVVEKTAGMNEETFDRLGGQIMAHSMTHEFRLMKTAMAKGMCRVCKEKPMDIKGSTICSACKEK